MKVLFLFFIISFKTYADSTCIGKVRELAIGRSGSVLIAGPGGLPSTYLCSVKSKQNNVEPEACKAMYGQLLSAQAQNLAVNITFNPAISSCTEVKSWGWATGFNWVIIKK